MVRHSGRALSLCAALALGLAITSSSIIGGRGSASSLQSSETVSITIQGFECPRGMDETSFDSSQCEPSEIPSVTVQYDNPDLVTLALMHASFDGSTYTWSELPLSDEGETQFRLTVRAAPLGSNGHIFEGDRVNSGGGSTWTNLSLDEPSASIQLFFLFPETPMHSGSVAPLGCPDADADYDECEPLDGVEIAIEIDGQPVYGSPFTTQDVPDIPLAVAYFGIVPLDSTLTITQISGLPEGYAPAPGYDPMTLAVVDLLEGPGGGGDQSSDYAYIINVPVGGMIPDDEATGEPSIDPSASPIPAEGRPVSIDGGSCTDLLLEASIVLTDLKIGTGSKTGAAAATSGEASLTTVAISLDELLASPYAIAVRADIESFGLRRDRRSASCGRLDRDRIA